MNIIKALGICALVAAPLCSGCMNELNSNINNLFGSQSAQTTPMGAPMALAQTQVFCTWDKDGFMHAGASSYVANDRYITECYSYRASMSTRVYEITTWNGNFFQAKCIHVEDSDGNNSRVPISGEFRNGSLIIDNQIYKVDKNESLDKLLRIHKIQKYYNANQSMQKFASNPYDGVLIEKIDKDSKYFYMIKGDKIAHSYAEGGNECGGGVDLYKIISINKNVITANIYKSAPEFEETLGDEISKPDEDSKIKMEFNGNNVIMTFIVTDYEKTKPYGKIFTKEVRVKYKKSNKSPRKVFSKEFIESLKKNNFNI